MATWKFECIVNASAVHDLFREVVVRWSRVDRCEEGGNYRFVVMKDFVDVLETAIYVTMSNMGNLYPELTFEVRDVCCDGDSYASFLVTVDRKGGR